MRLLLIGALLLTQLKAHAAEPLTPANETQTKDHAVREKSLVPLNGIALVWDGLQGANRSYSSAWRG